MILLSEIVVSEKNLDYVAQLIGTVGFPIVACIALFIALIYMMRLHREETKEFTEALNKNTVALTGLVQSIDAMQSVLKKRRLNRTYYE